MGDNIYISFWNSKIGEVIKGFEAGNLKFEVDLTGLDQYGDRESYYSKFKIIKGQLEIPKNAYAQGRDFFQVLSNTDYFKQYLSESLIHVTISKDLKLLIEMENSAPEFFTEEDFVHLKKFAGQEYNKNIPGMEETYQHLKQSYFKVEYWAQQVMTKVFSEGQLTIRKRPTNQANKFEYYQWARLYPNQDLLNWKNLAFTLSFSTDKDFCVKIDNVGLSDNDPLRQLYFKYRGDYKNSRIVKLFNSDEILSGGWNDLISKSVAAIKSLENDYYKLLKLLGYNSKDGDNIISGSLNVMGSLNSILYGPPGTGKTYNSIDKAVEIVAPDKHSADHKANKLVFDDLRKSGQIEFVTFHQNYSYEDFMVGIKPDIGNATLKFVPYKGIFYQICKRARDNYEAAKTGNKVVPYETLLDEVLNRITEDSPVEIKTTTGKPFWLTGYNDTTIYLKKSNGNEAHSLSISTLLDLAEGTRVMNSGLAVYYYPVIEYLRKNRKTENKEELKNFVLVIDEINRANISKVFGELITLLEDDKRLGKDNELRITLPNGELDFSVPPNLYVIGTMNTADKSIALIDIALRRRFEFVGYYPDYTKLSSEAATLLESINTKIFALKNSADYLIGHAYFMNGNSIVSTLRNKVIPLLMEYFSGKTNLVADVFKDTDWSVRYNTRTFGWDIEQLRQ